MLSREQLTIGLVGGIGGILPNLVDLGRRAVSGELERWVVTDTNLVVGIIVSALGCIIFFFVGAFVVIAFGEDNVKKAVILGISAPAFVISILNNPPSTGIVTSSLLDPMISSYAIAQDGTQKTRLLITSVDLSDQYRNIYLRFQKDVMQITFYSEDKSKIDSLNIEPNPQAVTVPKLTRWVGISATSAEPIFCDMMPGSGEELQVSLRIKRSYWNDFLRSLGQRYRLPYEIDVDKDQCSSGL